MKPRYTACCPECGSPHPFHTMNCPEKPDAPEAPIGTKKHIEFEMFVTEHRTKQEIAIFVTADVEKTPCGWTLGDYDACGDDGWDDLTDSMIAQVEEEILEQAEKQDGAENGPPDRSTVYRTKPPTALENWQQNDEHNVP